MRGGTHISTPPNLYILLAGRLKPVDQSGVRNDNIRCSAEMLLDRLKEFPDIAFDEKICLDTEDLGLKVQ